MRLPSFSTSEAPAACVHCCANCRMASTSDFGFSSFIGYCWACSSGLSRRLTVVLVGQCTWAHPDYPVAVMLLNPVDYQFKGFPTDTVARIHPLPMCIEDTARSTSPDLLHQAA